MLASRAHEALARLHARLRVDADFVQDDQTLQAYPAWQRPVRYYVSTACYDRGVLIHDGQDDVVMMARIA